MSSILSKVDEVQSLPAERESEGLYLVNGVHDAWAKLAALPPGPPPPSFLEIGGGLGQHDTPVHPARPQVCAGIQSASATGGQGACQE